MCLECSTMSQEGNFFDKVAAAPGEMETELLGPPYNYFKNIKTPTELGMSGKGDLGSLATDIDGLMSYTQLLVSGGGNATTTGKPLGNQFFLKTGGTCKDKDTGRQADRFMYINNVPDGSIPFISSGMGVQFTTFEGIIPGILSDIDKLNPLNLLKGFMEGSEPDCRNVSLPVTGQDGITNNEMRHVPDSEIASIQPCLFPSKTNPVTGESCREAFVNKYDQVQEKYLIYAVITVLLVLFVSRVRGQN